MPNLLARLLTRSFPGKSDTQFQPLGPEASGPEPAVPSGYESRALTLWLDTLPKPKGLEEGQQGSQLPLQEGAQQEVQTERQADIKGPRILDLGKVHTRSLNFFQEMGAGVGVMDLDISLVGTAFEMQLEGYRDWGPFDGVLAWDLPNYLEAEELTVLGQWLEAHTTAPSPLLVCMATRTPYADRPGKYSIENRTTLVADSAGIEVNRTQRHVPNVLKRSWPAFSPIRSYLLRSGMQEFVLTR